MFLKSTQITDALDAFDDSDAILKYCSFADLKVDGLTVDAVLLSCSLTRVDWYWGLFSGSLFVDTEFKDCQFYGARFLRCRFLNCKFENCEFGLDNMGKPCDFSDSEWFGCSSINTVGLPARATA